jgi:mRNA-degrading endonuclease RelE of RelBE toxin-antitoxin system
MKLKIDKDALDDIQKATDWYNKQVPGLGFRFQQQVKTHINRLKEDASLYAKRYENVRCLNIKTFPFMVHYTINFESDLVVVYAVIHTSRNPKIWKERK